MSLGRSMMTMRAVLSENIADDNDCGSPGKWEPGIKDPAQACYIWIKNKRHIADGVKVAVIEEVNGIFPTDSTIEFGDRISEVVDRNGEEAIAGVFDVKAVSQRTRGARPVIISVALMRVS